MIRQAGLLGLLLLLAGIFSCGTQEAQAQKPTIDRDRSLQLSNRGQTAMERGQYPHALQLCDSAMAFDPDNAHGLWVSSVVHIKQGRYPEAFAALDRAVELDPEGHLGYRGWIKFHYFRDLEGALYDFDRLITYDSLHGIERWDAYLNRGMLHHERADYTAALKDIRFYITKTGEDWADTEAFIYLARVLAAQDQISEALQACDKGLALYEKSPETWFLKGDLFRQAGNKQEACNCYKQALNHAQNGYLQTWPYGRRLHLLTQEEIREALRQHCP